MSGGEELCVPILLELNLFTLEKPLETFITYKGVEQKNYACLTTLITSMELKTSKPLSLALLMCMVQSMSSLLVHSGICFSIMFPALSAWPRPGLQ